ncbi:sigma-54-dependent Fis family transcriptional regulator [Vibrio fluvialis]|uniref:sigma-54-dependent Fis family transcriptional regulator n=1 Tax=Vibrio fluvialis TaxID=676 RepID=UPI001404E9CE|nr:sigma-54-dependent Fis family transcriptional regulator [Vibrio fluvialis]EKO3952067.1 sigma-54-dependent Fis family transcriptional regulator [Vibrio fluvialis]EKO3980246.1 sigma-54-dependent Fis family transcriptional regulator [Vibrio fluvialis]EKO4000805.1 sigma-54-dependent Fis family transcriptional regulator [Vibrio fluvialis]ELX7500262.1 sigma-54-dependent Fis family transcriptional regulator [Vibrio fluvialis]MBY8156924.1 sigma-54-dependent Fis family transcriptional regulator [Vib
MQIQSVNQDWLTTSWHRSQEAGLTQRTRPEHIRLPNYELKERKWRATSLLSAVEKYALPLFNQMCGHSDSRLILTDSEGVILATWGQQHFSERLTEIALESGACWQEKLKGTNAIGTAIVEARPVTIIGNQHYIRQHHFISCSACPLFNHQGELLGILDITSEQQQHDLSTQVLVQNMVQLVENHLLCDIPQGSTRIDLAYDRSLLNSGWQGIVIADEGGKVLAHNHIAAQLLAQNSVVGHSIEELFDTRAAGFVFEKHELKAKPRTTRAYSASCDLHFGDTHVEQAWQQANKLIDKDITLLILGETGVGKGEFVKALHKRSSRHSKALVSVNCGALPKDLIESELFGYVAGAFTGANSKGYQGKIRQADQGILFLDEIADMPLEAQSRLLHVLQDKLVVPVGSNQSYNVDIQIIAATHKDLEQAVAEGRFRQDLYYRLNGLVLQLPALRERQDKAALIEHIHHKYRIGAQALCPHLMTLLCSYHWPGNIRELDNLMKVASLLSSDEPELRLEHVPGHITKSLTSTALPPADSAAMDLKSTVEDTLLQAYQANQGNISRTSKMLGISRNTLYRKLKSLGILK